MCVIEQKVEQNATKFTINALRGSRVKDMSVATL